MNEKELKNNKNFQSPFMCLCVQTISSKPSFIFIFYFYFFPFADYLVKNKEKEGPDKHLIFKYFYAHDYLLPSLSAVW